MPETIQETVRSVGNKVKQVLSVLLLAGWSAGWAFVLLIGLIFSFGPVIAIAGGTLAFTAAGVIGTRVLKKRSLRRLAQSSLVSRAQLEGVVLDRETKAILQAFDLSHRNVKDLLGQPEMDPDRLGISIERDLENAREHLFHVVSTEMRLRRDLRQLEPVRTQQRSVSAAVEGLTTEIRRLEDEANKITVDTQKLAERLGRVRQLAEGSGPMRPAPGGELERVLEDLERTVAAYREIDDAQLESVEARARRALRQTAGD